MQRVVTIIFYLLLALFFFGIGFPFLKILLGICCVILIILSL